MDVEPPDALGPKRAAVINACEACRAAKVKCQTSEQLGTCKRCLSSKRECIFKTGPRTRRPRRSKYMSAPPRSPPPGPSKTFTIDIPLTTTDDVVDGFETLCQIHEVSVEGLVAASSDSDGPSDSVDNASPSPHSRARTVKGTSTFSSVFSPARSFSTPSSRHEQPSPPQPQQQQQQKQQQQKQQHQDSIHAAAATVQPQFNLDSATSLLATFRSQMLPRFPCVTIPPDATIPSLARDRPFLLLAVLAAASGCRSLRGHGHGLYDGEFRRALGLRVVSGGECSVEVLQALLVYCAWYPFHLQPKNRQAMRYVRMAVDMVRELELDRETQNSTSQERLEGMRAYLGCYYLVSRSASTWNKPSPLSFDDWTEQCCVTLELEDTASGTLAWLCRLEHIAAERRSLLSGGCSHGEHQTSFLLKGLETQLAEWQRAMGLDRGIRAPDSLIIANLFTNVWIQAAPIMIPSLAGARQRALLKNTFATSSSSPSSPATPASSQPTTTTMTSPERLAAAIPPLRALLDHVLSLPRTALTTLSAASWSHVISCIVLAFRTSFPAPSGCPGWDPDAQQQRQQQPFDFGEYLDRLCHLGDGDGDGDGKSGGDVDVVAASRAVMGVVRSKYLARKRTSASGERTKKKKQREQQHEQINDKAGDVGNYGGWAEPLLPTQPQDGYGSWDATGGPEWSVPGQGLDPMLLQLDKAAAAAASAAGAGGCPVLDGSMDQYMSLWNEHYTGSAGLGQAAGIVAMEPGLKPDAGPTDDGTQQVTLQDDFWQSLTMGWTDDRGQGMSIDGL